MAHGILKNKRFKFCSSRQLFRAYVLENKSGVWRYSNKIEGFDISSRFFHFSKQTVCKSRVGVYS